jgi:hypothetical protein
MSAKEIVRWTWIPVLLVFAYSGWVLYNRKTYSERLAREHEQKEAAADRQILEKLGSGNLKILMLYANPPVIRRGEKVLLCYGVANADTVRFDPPVEGAGPSLSRCLETHPTKTASYTLIAEDAAKTVQKSTVTVRVEN